jgi:hypothetical protein
MNGPNSDRKFSWKETDSKEQVEGKPIKPPLLTSFMFLKDATQVFNVM